MAILAAKVNGRFMGQKPLINFVINKMEDIKPLNQWLKYTSLESLFNVDIHTFLQFQSSSTIDHVKSISKLTSSKTYGKINKLITLKL